MFKMKADDHNFRTIVATDKNYILRKRVWNFEIINLTSRAK